MVASTASAITISASVKPPWRAVRSLEAGSRFMTLPTQANAGPWRATPHVIVMYWIPLGISLADARSPMPLVYPANRLMGQLAAIVEVQLHLYSGAIGVDCADPQPHTRTDLTGRAAFSD